MRSEEEIRQDLNYQLRQGYLDYSLNPETNPVRIAFVDGYIMALKWVLGKED